MKGLGYLFINLVGTLLRAFPLPCKTGCIPVGNPGPDSPVFLTCNYSLTVERVKRALRGLDAYLLVANSRGINVWCAATGGLLTNHDVISVLKTSGIEGRVNHRNVILPQLAATGIERKTIHRKTGWRIVWGPVYAADIPAFLQSQLRKTTEMSQVRFPLGQRLEMAIMWAFPFSLIAVPVTLLFWPSFSLLLAGLIWLVSLATYLLFPFYSRWLDPHKKGTRISRYTIVFDFSKSTAIVWAFVLALLVLITLATKSYNWEFVWRWGFASLVIALLINMDLMGSTPIYKSGLHEDRFLKVTLDESKCRGAGFCEQVCPRNCFIVDKSRHLATIPGAERCVQCGACIVQCPFDALYFKAPSGQILPPETIRKFKLNLMGKRLAKS